MEERMFHMDILCTTLKEIKIKQFVQSAELSFEKVIFDRKSIIFHIICNVVTVKPVYKGHSREPENVPFIYRLKLYGLFINGKNQASLYRQ